MILSFSLTSFCAKPLFNHRASNFQHQTTLKTAHLGANKLNQSPSLQPQGGPSKPYGIYLAQLLGVPSENVAWEPGFFTGVSDKKRPRYVSSQRLTKTKSTPVEHHDILSPQAAEGRGCFAHNFCRGLEGWLGPLVYWMLSAL